MKRVINLSVNYNQIQVYRQLFCLSNSYDSNENELILNECKYCSQIDVKYSLCQTICFTKKLISCVDYRRIVFNTLHQLMANRCQGLSSCPTDDTSDQNVHSIALWVELESMDHYLVVDKKWNNRIMNFVWVRVRVEDSLSWLSTLGGACSSLGEYDVQWAIKAGEISLTQLRLAVITGDPNVVAKCGIYMAYSLCQQNRRRKAIQMVRRTLFPYISRIDFCDQIVKSMFKALCYRIKHFYSN